MKVWMIRINLVHLTWLRSSQVTRGHFFKKKITKDYNFWFTKPNFKFNTPKWSQLKTQSSRCNLTPFHDSYESQITSFIISQDSEMTKRRATYQNDQNWSLNHLKVIWSNFMTLREVQLHVPIANNYHGNSFSTKLKSIFLEDKK